VGVLEQAAVHAVLAPSSHNSQPWTIGVEAEVLTVRADRSRALPVTDPDGRELVISCGAALLNARVAAAQLAGGAEWQAFPDPGDPDLLARLRVGEAVPGSADGAMLFDAIPKRRTYRLDFAERQVAPPLVTELSGCARDEGARLRVLGSAERPVVTALIGEGNRAQWADGDWRRELAAWLRSRRMGDGLTVPAVVAPLVRQVVTRIDLGAQVARRDQRLAESAPVLALLETAGDAPEDWLAAGQALERLLLRAAASGLQASFLNQPVQVDALRPRLRTAAGGEGHPQLVLRLGYPGKPVPATPRRPLLRSAPGPS
jgi:Nitroreductase family